MLHGTADQDTTHCQGSPEVDLKQTDEHATLVGHDTHKSSVVLSQTCTDPKSGDVCQIDYGFDVWLTSDEIPGVADRQAFSKNYLAAQGLDPNNPKLQGMVQQFMAPYADTLKQLQGKSSDLKGYPLRTLFYMQFGGPQCGKAHEAQTQQTQAQAQSGGTTKGFLKGLAGNAVSGGLGGLFKRNVNINTSTVGGSVAANAANQTADAATNAASNAAGSAAANAVSSAPSGSSSASSATGTPSDKVRMVSFQVETTSIDTASIPSDLFEIPAGWRQQQPKEVQAKEKQFTCPSPTGN